MTKIITTAILALLLTACTSQENGEEKKFNTEKKVEKSETKVEAVKKETSPAKTVEATPKVETYAKNIFELTTVGGEIIHVDEAENGIVFQEHKDKVVFLLFFGYRCPPCLSEIPALLEIAKEKGDKLEIIAMEVQRLPEEQLKIFKESKKLNYTVLSGEHTGNSEFISYIAERAQWTGSIPFLVGITPKGEVGVVHVGGMGKNEFEKVFDQLSK
jgi:thiol-disulfide isomerase/thioredoxin